MSNKRNLSLAPRAEDTREVQPVSVVNFELSEIKDHFDQSLTAIKNQFEVASSLGSDGKTEDQKNIYRSQIVFLESAFDFYLHELTKFGLRKMLVGSWPKTEKYKNIRIVTGVNFPLMLELAVRLENGISNEELNSVIEESKNQLMLVDLNPDKFEDDFDL